MIRSKELRMLLLLLSTLTMTSAQAQDWRLKTNLAYWATTTPNIGLETAVGKKHTAQVFVGFNPWKQSGGDQSDPVCGGCDRGGTPAEHGSERPV